MGRCAHKRIAPLTLYPIGEIGFWSLGDPDFNFNPTTGNLGGGGQGPSPPSLFISALGCEYLPDKVHTESTKHDDRHALGS